MVPNGTALEGDSADEHRCIEVQSRRPPRPDRFGQALDVGAHWSGVARPEDRLRQQQPDAAAVRPGEADGQHQELGRRIGIRAATATARPAPGRRSGKLGEIGRVAEDDVVGRLGPVPGQGVADLDADVATPGEHRARRLGGTGVDIDAVEDGDAAATDDMVGSGSEEAPVAARRVEDTDPLTGGDRWHHGIDHATDELDRCRKVATKPPALPGAVARR